MAMMWKKCCREERPGGGLRKVLCVLLIATVVGMCSGLESVTHIVPWVNLRQKDAPDVLPAIDWVRGRMTKRIFDGMSVSRANVPDIRTERVSRSSEKEKYLVSSDRLMRTEIAPPHEGEDGETRVPVPVPMRDLPTLTRETKVKLVLTLLNWDEWKAENPSLFEKHGIEEELREEVQINLVRLLLMSFPGDSSIKCTSLRYHDTDHWWLVHTRWTLALPEAWGRSGVVMKVKGEVTHVSGE